VAAAAITGGDAFKTMMLTLRYTLPAFLVPFAFVLSPNGQGLLLQGPILGIAWTLAVAAVAVAALAEVHPSAGRLELETAPKVAPLELHPGARRYYDEQAST
jgi:TRAP-type uncharacterized transport system fused permease subunit